MDAHGRGEARAAELGRVAYFRPDTLPKDFQSERPWRHYVPRHQGFAFTNGIQLSHVGWMSRQGSSASHTGASRLRRIINPRLVDDTRGA